MGDSATKQRIICVTGPMAAGKNAAAAILEQMGWLSIDADRTAHQAIENKRDEIVATFGPLAEQQHICITNQDGSINRRALGSILFSDPELLSRQEAIVHPEVVRIITLFIREHADRNIILNATVLFKTPELMQLCESVLYIDAPLLTRLSRAKKRDGHSTGHILKRFHTQRNLLRSYKATGIPVHRIMNSSTLEKLTIRIQSI